MGLPNKDEIEGKWDQAKGATKETVGRALNDRDLETEGGADRTGGKAVGTWAPAPARELSNPAGPGCVCQRAWAAGASQP